MMSVMIRWDRTIRARALRMLAAVLVSSAPLACGSSAVGPGGTLPDGRWTGDGACLAVAESGCDLVAGCGHGQFPKPVLRPDGSFDVEGTYRIEVGPVSTDPPPPARFSGSWTDSTLRLTVVPTAPLPTASYSLRRNAAGTCVVPCV
jgi:hypothetical protein